MLLATNVGADVICSGVNHLGFLAPDFDDPKPADPYTKTRAAVVEQLKEKFVPELVNRLDEIVVFRPLEREHIREIAVLQLADVKERLMDTWGIELHVGEDVMEVLLDEGCDRKLGARPLRRAIVRHVEDAMSDAILNGRVRIGVGASGF